MVTNENADRYMAMCCNHLSAPKAFEKEIIDIKKKKNLSGQSKSVPCIIVKIKLHAQLPSHTS